MLTGYDGNIIATKNKCCAKIAIGGGGGGRFKSKRIPQFAGANLVGGLSGYVDFFAIICKNNESLEINKIGGAFIGSVAGGPRWELKYEKKGAKITTFVEGGVKGKFIFDFETLKANVDGAFYSRAVHDIEIGDKWKRRYSRSWNADDLGW
jgi:hypothetical protein